MIHIKISASHSSVKHEFVLDRRKDTLSLTQDMIIEIDKFLCKRSLFGTIVKIEVIPDSLSLDL